MHTAVGIQIKGHMLDGIVTSPSEAKGNYPGVVVCHPHPLLGGNMDNAVVVGICEALAQGGVVSLRFDFRRDRSDEGADALERNAAEDAVKAFEMLRSWPGVEGRHTGLAGYSFGAAVILNALPRLRKARAFVFVAPSLRSVEQAMKALADDGRPKLFLVGDQDKLVPAERLKSVVQSLPSSTLQIVTGTDHGWHGREAEAARLATEFLKGSLGHASS